MFGALLGRKTGSHLFGKCSSVGEEDQHVEAALGDLGADLLIPAQRPHFSGVTSSVGQASWIFFPVVPVAQS